jgi:hypothetical protein
VRLNGREQQQGLFNNSRSTPLPCPAARLPFSPCCCQVKKSRGHCSAAKCEPCPPHFSSGVALRVVFAFLLGVEPGLARKRPSAPRRCQAPLQASWCLPPQSANAGATERGMASSAGTGAFLSQSDREIVKGIGGGERGCVVCEEH